MRQIQKNIATESSHRQQVEMLYATIIEGLLQDDRVFHGIVHADDIVILSTESDISSTWLNLTLTFVCKGVRKSF